jgi:hypothetical protein
MKTIGTTIEYSIAEEYYDGKWTEIISSWEGRIHSDIQRAEHELNRIRENYPNGRYAIMKSTITTEIIKR